jgi:hypothetical protein
MVAGTYRGDTQSNGLEMESVAIFRWFVPQKVRRVAHPVRSVKRQLTPKPVRAVYYARHPVGTATSAVTRRALQPQRSKRARKGKSRTPVPTERVSKPRRSRGVGQMSSRSQIRSPAPTQPIEHRPTRPTIMNVPVISPTGERTTVPVTLPEGYWEWTRDQQLQWAASLAPTLHEQGWRAIPKADQVPNRVENELANMKAQLDARKAHHSASLIGKTQSVQPVRGRPVGATWDQAHWRVCKGCGSKTRWRNASGEALCEHCQGVGN